MLARFWRDARRLRRTLVAIHAAPFITPTCSKCGEPVSAPDVHWHPWTGYVHRHCWEPIEIGRVTIQGGDQ